MSLSAAAAAARAVHVSESGSRSVLDRLHDQGCAAAIWQRSLDPLLLSWLEALPGSRLPRLRQTVYPSGAYAAVDAACERAGLHQGPGRERLCRDIANLAAVFSQLMAARQIALRLDAVSDDACRRFHLDHVPARLLCTYRGQGTQYGIAGPDGQPRAVHQMATGWVGLLRGHLWPGTEPCGLVHRSPPIGDSGEVRLLLVLDVAEGFV